MSNNVKSKKQNQQFCSELRNETILLRGKAVSVKNCKDTSNNQESKQNIKLYGSEPRIEARLLIGKTVSVKEW